MSVTSSPRSPVVEAPNASFGRLEQIDAGLLNGGYVEAGPSHGPVVVLLHG